jgi:hypothetical protein
MGKKTRKEKLVKMLTERLHELEDDLISSPNKFTDEEYNALISESVRIRETIRVLKLDEDES